MPQLWQKWHTMMAHTSFLLNSLPQGMTTGWLLLLLPLLLLLLLVLEVPPWVLAAAMVPCAVLARMYLRSALDMLLSSAGVLAALFCGALRWHQRCGWSPGSVLLHMRDTSRVSTICSIILRVMHDGFGATPGIAG